MLPHILLLSLLFSICDFKIVKHNVRKFVKQSHVVYGQVVKSIHEMPFVVNVQTKLCAWNLPHLCLKEERKL